MRGLQAQRSKELRRGAWRNQTLGKMVKQRKSNWPTQLRRHQPSETGARNAKAVHNSGVCVTPRANVQEMIDLARIVAERFHGELIVAYVSQPQISPADQATLDQIGR